MAKDKDTIVDRVKKHPIVAIVVLCLSVAAISASTTWKLANELLVRPRDYRITQLETNPSTLTLDTPQSPTTSFSVSFEVVNNTGDPIELEPAILYSIRAPFNAESREFKNGRLTIKSVTNGATTDALAIPHQQALQYVVDVTSDLSTFESTLDHDADIEFTLIATGKSGRLAFRTKYAPFKLEQLNTTKIVFTFAASNFLPESVGTSSPNETDNPLPSSS